MIQKTTKKRNQSRKDHVHQLFLKICVNANVQYLPSKATTFVMGIV